MVQGQVVETGVGFSLTVDYNRFSQIFRRKTEKDKEILKKAKEQNKEDKKEEKAKEKAVENKEQQTSIN